MMYGWFLLYVMFMFNTVIEHTELVNKESSPQGEHRLKCLAASDHSISICFLCFPLWTYTFDTLMMTEHRDLTESVVSTELVELSTTPEGG